MWFRKWSWSFIIFQDLLLFVILFEVPQYMYETLGCRYQISTPHNQISLSLFTPGYDLSIGLAVIYPYLAGHSLLRHSP